jgi:ADP-ribosylglycohydrolase
MLVDWENSMRARGSLDLLGPSTRSAVAAVIAGVSVETTGRFGVTNGAAMRVTPVGICVSAERVDRLVDRVQEASSVTHNTGTAIAGASAIAAAVSAGIDGATVAEAISVGIRAAEIGAGRGFWVAGADVARRIEWATGLMDPRDEGRSLSDIVDLVGTSLATQESVPAAFALIALFDSNPWRGCLAAASLGGDTDTVAAMVGTVGGACHGMAGFPPDAVATVVAVNDLDLGPLVRDLLALR